MNKKQKRFAGKFGLVGDEPLGKTIGVRLPQSLEKDLRERVAIEGVTLSEFISRAVAKALE